MSPAPEFAARPASPDELEVILRRESGDWREGHLLRIYDDSRPGLALQADEEAILAGHGYLTQSSELTRDGSLMVAYVRAAEADIYTPLANPGLSAATDPDSLAARFARPLAWAVVIIVGTLALLLLMASLGSLLGT